MGKKVLLTWRFDPNTVITETVFQLDGDEPVYLEEEAGLGSTIFNPYRGNTVNAILDDHKDSVIFEDDQGLFMLKTEQVLDIQPAED